MLENRLVTKLHLAEFNIGTLKYDWDDPRVADFQNNLDRVFAIAERFDGYIWHLKGPEMEAAQLDPTGPLGGDPRTASTLSVWRDLAALERFVWKTVHKRFYDRRAEWYGPQNAWGGLRLVMWWVPIGQIPTITEAAARLRQLVRDGDSDTAFGWDYARATWGETE
ncbi:protein of unknown function [Antarctobacter heliothermus]|uniref:DUF3291 domain-containing protein n=1 Tax=Antarctobacter heliothermus TaxID=74033 RepID=A0A239D351_9RHOB|nr:protein of unknown function [Antarctobacter heliothermus]